MKLQTVLKYKFITFNDALLCNTQVAQGISFHAICSSVVNHKVWLELFKCCFQAILDVLKILLVGMATSNTDCAWNMVRCFCVSRVNAHVIGIENVVLWLIRVVFLVSVALMRIEVDYHELSQSVPQLHVMSYKCDIWIYTEAFSLWSRCVMVTSSQIDGPPFSSSYTCRFYTSEWSTCHWFE